jgi:hypothetical protein
MFIGAARKQKYKAEFIWDTYLVTLNDDGMEKYTKYKTFKHTIKGNNASDMRANAKKWLNKKILSESQKVGKYIASEGKSENWTDL